MITFSEYISNLKFDDLNDEVIAKTKTCLFDTLGSILGSKNFVSVNIVNDFAMILNGYPSATLIGAGKKISVPGAALGNASAAAALDIDDCHVLGQGHPGAVVIPAALAVAESIGASGKNLIVGIVAGYEVAVRSGALQASNPGESLVWGSGRWACPGAAAACAKIYKLSANQTAHAVGIAETFSPKAPLLDTVQVKPLAMTKESIGWGSMVGVTGAMLARNGYTGPKLEYGTVAGKIGPFGKDFTILGVTYKPYPSCRWTHSAIDAVLSLKAEYPGCITPETIQDINVRVFKKAIHINHPTPDSVETAQYSIPFTVAVAISDGEVWLEQMSNSRLTDPRVLETAAKVKIVHVPEFDAAFPARPEEVVIWTKNNTVYRKRIDYPKGDLENPLSLEQLKSKFIRLATVSVSEKTAHVLLGVIETIENQRNVSCLMEIFHQ